LQERDERFEQSREPLPRREWFPKGQRRSIGS